MTLGASQLVRCLACEAAVDPAAGRCPDCGGGLGTTPVPGVARRPPPMADRRPTVGEGEAAGRNTVGFGVDDGPPPSAGPASRQALPAASRSAAGVGVGSSRPHKTLAGPAASGPRAVDTPFPVGAAASSATPFAGRATVMLGEASGVAARGHGTLAIDAPHGGAQRQPATGPRGTVVLDRKQDSRAARRSAASPPAAGTDAARTDAAQATATAIFEPAVGVPRLPRRDTVPSGPPEAFDDPPEPAPPSAVTPPSSEPPAASPRPPSAAPPPEPPRSASPIPASARAESQLVQRYADGVNVSHGDAPGAAASPGARVVTLPYPSTAVRHRLDRYDLLDELGRGGMGVVYRAYSLHLERFCAVKLMTAGVHAGEAAAIRFQNEARIAGCLTHPNIVSIFDSGEDDEGRLYFVMEVVDGVELGSFIPAPHADGQGAPARAAADEPDLQIAVRAITKAARALAHAHAKGVIHRDIKPENILVDVHGEPHITDFGIARRETDPGLTADGSAMGTPSYMSPEQANGESAAIGPATDVYSLGATLYHVLTGRPPFDGDNPYAVMKDVIGREPEPPTVVARRLLGRELPADLETICLKAMEKEVEARYPSAEALADDLEAFLADRPIAARPIGRAERLRKLIRRNKGAFVGASLIGVTLMVMTVAFGAVLIFNVERTSGALRDLDSQAGVEQASTLERAIRTNMLQGRADVVRELVGQLREDPNVASIDVVRPDRTFAYTDRSTRVKVQRRLDDPALMAEVAAERPGLVDKIADLRRVGFGAIDRAAAPPGGLFDADRATWNRIVADKEVVAVSEVSEGKPVLTVYKPIENSDACQVCHGEPGEIGYDANEVRGVLVVRRSQEGLVAQIDKNRLDTILIGAGTAVVLLLFLITFARLTGIGLPRRRFGA